MNTGNTVNTSDSLAQYNPYEKLLNVFSICMEIVHVSQLYKIFKEEIKDRNEQDITVLFDRIFFDHIVINWAKIFGSISEDLHISKVFTKEIYSFESVREDFLKEIHLSEKEYSQMNEHLRGWRNKILAHFDFDQVYDLTYNANYFEKIQPQCKSVAASVIKAFDAAGEKNPEFECGINSAPRNFKLKEIAEMLQHKLTDYPKDFSCSKWKTILQKLVEDNDLTIS